jgi:hypothetical protein
VVIAGQAIVRGVVARGRLRAFAVSAAVALAAAGCTSADEDGVRETIAKLETALRAKDPAAVCALYEGDQPFCRAHFGLDELRSVGFGGRIDVVEVDVDGDDATARVENVRGHRRVRGTARLRKAGDEWLLVPPGVP